MTPLARLLGRAVDVREDEVRALALGFAYFFALLCAYYVLRPVREEMGIAGGVRNLPWLFTATFVAMLFCVPLYGWVASRWPRRVFLPLTYRFFTLCLIAFFVAFQFDAMRPVLARIFFVWLSVFSLFVVSVFWSFMSDLFSSTQGKRLFGFIAAGGSLGAIIGPGITALLAKETGPVPLLLAAVVLLEGAIWCIKTLGREADTVRAAAPDAHESAGERALGGGWLDGIVQLFRSPYLLGIGAYILLHSLTGTFLYFEQANIVAGAFTDPGERTRVFALIDLVVNTLTVLTQLFATGRFVARVGIGWAGSFLPAINALGFLALTLTPALGALVAFQVLRRTADYAVSRPAREVLYTSVHPEERYKAKNVIDTLVYRGGDAASGWAFDALAGAGMGVAAIAALGVPIALAWIVLALALGRRHERAAQA
jgi:AAA family ATP:ADP antiporter